MSNTEVLHESWPTARTDALTTSLQVVCAWCQCHLRWHRVPNPIPFPVSYSICSRCYHEVARECAPQGVGAA